MNEEEKFIEELVALLKEVIAETTLGHHEINPITEELLERIKGVIGEGA